MLEHGGQCSVIVKLIGLEEPIHELRGSILGIKLRLWTLLGNQKLFKSFILSHLFRIEGYLSIEDSTILDNVFLDV